jgi:hypothetical protein
VENAITFFYLGDSSAGTRAPQMLNSMPARSREIMLANMMQLASLTLRILKSLYPWADLDMAGEGFIVTCSGKEALRLVEDSAMTVGHIVDMLPVDMSLG